jgi:hypothetical protein
VDKTGLHRELLNEVKRSIQKLRKANGQLEVMARDAIMRMVKCWKILPQH